MEFGCVGEARRRRPLATAVQEWECDGRRSKHVKVTGPAEKYWLGWRRGVRSSAILLPCAS